MSGQLGELVISLAADTARFRSDLGKATKATQDSAKEMSAHFTKMGDALKTTVGLMAGLAGVASLGSLVKGSIDAADNMSKMSQKVGVAIEQLSGMSYAAGLADVSTEQLGKGMGKLAKTMYDAFKDGKGSAADTFRNLGISVTDASGQIRATDAVMMDVAERLSTMDDGAAKTAISMEIFGKAGADLIPLLNGGKKGLQEAADEAKRFGLVLTAEAGRQAEEFNDNLTRLKSLSSGVAITIANELLPQINEIVGKFAQGGDISNGPFMQGLHRVQAEFIRLAMLADKAGGSMTSAGMLLYGPGAAIGNENSKKQFEKMADWNIMFKERYEESEKSLQAMANLEVGLDADGNPFKPKKSASSKGGTFTPGTSIAATVDASKYSTSNDLLLQNILKYKAARIQAEEDILEAMLDSNSRWAKEQLQTAADNLEFMLDSNSRWAKDQIRAAAEVEASRQMMYDMDSNIEASEGYDYGTQARQLEKAHEERKLWIEREITSNEEKHKLLLKAAEEYAKGKKALDAEAAMISVQSAANSISTIGATLMQGNKEQFEAGKSMAMAGATIDMFAGAVGAYKAMASIPIVGPALGVAAAAAVVASGTMNIAQISAQQYEPRALGGPVLGGTSYLVGEKGPEIFTAGASGQITSNDKLNRLGGGAVINVTPVYQISPGVPEAARAEMMRMAPYFDSRAIAAVKQAMREGKFQGF